MLFDNRDIHPRVGEGREEVHGKAYPALSTGCYLMRASAFLAPTITNCVKVLTRTNIHICLLERTCWTNANNGYGLLSSQNRNPLLFLSVLYSTSGLSIKRDIIFISKVFSNLHEFFLLISISSLLQNART